MKFIILLGGFSGFALSFLAGLAAGNDPLKVLIQACLACLAGALLFRWFGQLCVRHLRAARADRSSTTAGPDEPSSEPQPKTAQEPIQSI
ncbi:MAG: hypothetical protein EA425_11000 [Puniceicoccaceae bacterium]|nr:MAG: hypothetical protein EA425_11000 [Puniceicoccaceae bacterium]